MIRTLNHRFFFICAAFLVVPVALSLVLLCGLSPYASYAEDIGYADDLELPEDELPDGTPVDQDVTYCHAQTAEQNGVTFTVYWDEPVLGQETHFHVVASGASNQAKAKVVADTSKSKEQSYTTLTDGECDFAFNMMSPGSNQLHFYFADAGKGIYDLHAQLNLTVSDTGAILFAIPASTFTYTGSAITPSVKSSVVPSNCYSISYQNNVNTGQGTAIITGKGSWVGTCKLAFAISAADISKAQIAQMPNATYTSSAITPNPSLTFAGKTLSLGSDYTTAYRDNVKVGTATVVITGKGNFTGTQTTTFKIYRASPASYPNGLSRISGATRYETMDSLAKAGNWSTGRYVVLASGSNYPDALAAAALAGVKDAPILLTDPNNLSDATRSRLASLHPSVVYIIGGQAAVSSSVEQQVKHVLSNCKISRLYGATRYETSARVAAEVRGFSDTVIIATGSNYADALSVSPYAFTTGSPVLLCSTSGLSSAAVAEIVAGGYKRAVIVGGTAAVPSSIETQLRGAGVTSIKRLAGATRYETSAEIARYELGAGIGFSMNGLSLATGQNFPDALAAGPLAGRHAAPLLLVDPSGISTASFLASYRGQVSQACIVGGTAAVSDSAARQIANALGIGIV